VGTIQQEMKKFSGSRFPHPQFFSGHPAGLKREKNKRLRFLKNAAAWPTLYSLVAAGNEVSLKKTQMYAFSLFTIV